MAGKTYLQLRTSAKARADLANAESITDAEWGEYINAGAYELHDVLVSSDSSSLVSIANINVSSGAEAYTLPADFYKIVGVYRINGGDRFSLARTDFHGLGEGANITYYIGGCSRYALVGNQIYFSPKPSSADSIQLWYRPSFAGLVNDTDTLDYPVVPGWEQFVIVTAIIKAKTKLESNINAELAEKAELKKRIADCAAERDKFNPLQARDDYGITSRLNVFNMTSSAFELGNVRRRF